MPVAIAVLLVLLWLDGLFVARAGASIHMLLGLAIISAGIRMLQSRSRIS